MLGTYRKGNVEVRIKQNVWRRGAVYIIEEYTNGKKTEYHTTNNHVKVEQIIRGLLNDGFCPDS